MRKAIPLAVLGLSMALAGQALAHGAKAKHGGTVQTAGDLSFELVAKDGKAVIYIDDHGAALPSAGASGTLTLLAGGVRSNSALEAGENNILVSTERVKLARGSKAVAAIILPGKESMNLRFSVK